MCSNNKAFTIIELLGVVLIIGILAAVAVPQYQKAVAKSRLTQDLIRVRALHAGAEIYYLANGAYPQDVRNVDLDVTGGVEVKTGSFMASGVPAAFYSDGTECMIISGYYAVCGKISDNYYIQYNLEHPIASNGGPGRQSCCGKSNTRMEATCRSLSRTTRRDWINVDYNCYFLN